jgi:hypothetical protein
MIQVFVDDGGLDEKSSVLTFSALIGEASKWAEFSDKWDTCLRESPSIRYFKMDEAVGKNHEFYGFTEIERDNKLRSLCAVINGVSATEISALLDLSGHTNSWGKTASRPLSEPYFFPFQTINMEVAYEVGAMGATEQPYEIFFDENVIFGPRAKAWYPVMRAFQDEPVKKLMPIEPFFRSDMDILPLQAADLVAWIERQYETTGLGNFRWVDEELTGLNHSNLTQFLDEKFIRDKL